MRTLLLLAAFTSAAIAQTPTAPPPPPSIDPPAGTTLLLKAKGDGVQTYTCTDGQWVFKAPEATLLDAKGNILGKHFAGPTWQLMNPGATSSEIKGEVKGKAIANRPSTDILSVPWLLLQAVSPVGSLSKVTYIRRIDTHGGAAPKAPCTSGQVRVPYTASYEFYTGGK